MHLETDGELFVLIYPGLYELERVQMPPANEVGSRAAAGLGKWTSDLFEGWNSVKMMNQQFSHSNYSLLWSGKWGKFQVLMSVLKQLNEWNPDMIPINIWQFFQPCHDLGVGRLTKIWVFLRVYVSWGMVKSCHEWKTIPTVLYVLMISCHRFPSWTCEWIQGSW